MKMPAISPAFKQEIKSTATKTGAWTAAGIAATYGVAKGVGALINPVESAKEAYTNSAIVSNNASTVAGGVAMAAVGLGVAATTTKYWGPVAGSMAKGVGKGTVGVGKGIHAVVDKLQDKVVRSAGKSWDTKGKMNTFKTSMKMGAVYGAVHAAADLSLNRYVSQEAMASSQEGGIYEGGSNFGTRTSSALKTLGSSAMGVGFGLHNNR